MRSAYQSAFLVFLLLVGTKVYAQTESKEPSGVIAGRISAEGAPLPGVAVMVTAGTSFQGNIAGRATTDDQGRYRITGLAAGDYSINPFTPAYYYPSSPYFGPRGKAVSLDDGETVDGIDFKLVRGGVITGKVTDSTGKPVVEQQVQLALIDENHNRMPMAFNPYSFTTDDRGLYRLYGLEPGRYLVSVGRGVGKDGGIYMGGPSHYYPLTYHPAASDESAAEIVEIAPGGEAQSVDIVVGKTAVGYSARGHVVNADTGQPAAGVMIAYGIRRPDGNGIGAFGIGQNSQTDAQGEFRIDGVTAGLYAAFAVPLADGDFYSDQAPFEIADADVEGLEVTVHKGGSISGVVTVEGNSDPSIAARLPQLSLMARSLQSPSSGFASSRPIAPDGTFRLIGLAPGKTMISLANPNQSNGFSIARIEVNGIEQSGSVDVAAGQQVTGARVVLSYGTGLIRGRVKIEGGTLSESAMLRVFARKAGAPSGTAMGMGAAVDARGQFLVQGLVDGEYLLTLTVLGPAKERQMQPKPQKASVTQGAAAEVIFVLDLSKEN